MGNPDHSGMDGKVVIDGDHISRYRLSDFTPNEIAAAKIYLKKAFYGYLRTCLDNKIDQAFDQLARVEFFTEVDAIRFKWDSVTVGADFLAALGVAKNESKSQS